jgi:hypothetical protein
MVLSSTILENRNQLPGARDEENSQVSIIRRSGFSREHRHNSRLKPLLRIPVNLSAFPAPPREKNLSSLWRNSAKSMFIP